MPALPFAPNNGSGKMVNEHLKLKKKILRCVLSEMSKMDLNKTPPHMAHFIHQYIKGTQIDDPYRSLKKNSISSL